jgi:hypothetical protein
MGAHATGSTIAPLNGGGIGRGIAQAIQHWLDTGFGAMCIVDVYLHDAIALAVLNHLNMRQCARDAIAHIGKAASTPVSAGAIRLSEYLRKQALLAGFAVREQDQRMAIC